MRKEVRIGVSGHLELELVVVASERENQLGGIVLEPVVEKQAWVCLAKMVGLLLRQMLARVFFDRVKLEHETAVFYQTLEGSNPQVQSETFPGKTKGWMMGDVEGYFEVSLWVSVGAHLRKKNPTE